MSYTPYVKQTWDTTSYVNPTRMNHIEDGIKSNSDGISSLNTDLANKISVLTLDSGYTKIQDIPTGMYSLTASLMLALTDRPSGYVGGRCYLTTQKQVADDWYEVLYNPSAQSMWTRYRYGSVGGWQKVVTDSDLAYSATTLTTPYGNLRFYKYGKVVTVHNQGDLGNIPSGDFTLGTIPSGYVPAIWLRFDERTPNGAVALRFSFNNNGELTCHNYAAAQSGAVNISFNASYMTA